MSASLRRLATRHAGKTLAVSALFAFGAASAQAATFNYKGTGTTTTPIGGNFSGTNFSPTIASGTTSVTTTADTLSFAGGTAYTATDDLTSTILANMLLFTNTATVTLARGGAGTTNSITLGGTNPGVTTSTGAVADALDLVLNVTPTFNIGTGGMTISGIVSGAGGLTKSTGAGVLTLTGVNTYTGATTVNAGVLSLANASGSLALSSSPITVTGGEFRLDNSLANNNARLDATQTFTLNGGLLDILTANTGGTTTETLGAVSTVSANSVGATQSQIAVQPQGTGAGNITFASITRSAGQGVILVDGIGLGKDSSSTTSVGRVFLTTAPTLVGTTAATTTGINTSSKNTQIVPYLLGETTAITTGALGGVGNANTFLTYNATTGLRPLNPTDEFTLNAITATNNTYLSTGTTTVTTSAAINSLVLNGGNLTINTGQTLTNTSGALLFAANGSVLGSTSAASTLALGSAEGIVTVNSGVTGTFGATSASNVVNISGTGGLTKSGAGTLVLKTPTSVNTNQALTGAINILQGTINAQATGGFVFPAADPINVSNGATMEYQDHAGGTNVNIANPFTLYGNGGGTGALFLYNSGAFSFTNTIGLASDAVIRYDAAGQNAGVTFAGVISGAGALSLVGASSGAALPLFILNKANTYGTGNQNTLLTNSGTPLTTLELSTVTNVLPSTTTLTFGGNPTGVAGTFNGPASLALDGISQTVAALTTAGSGTYRVIGNNATVSNLIVNNAGTDFFGGILGGAGTNNNNFNLSKTAAGTLVLSGANTFTGSTTIAGGAIQVSGSGKVGTGNLVINTGGTLDLNGTNQTVDALSGTATAQAIGSGATGTSTLTIGNSNGSGTFGGIIANAANPFTGTPIIALTKTGTGTQTLSGANTYTGATTVSGGALTLTGSLGATPITVGAATFNAKAGSGTQSAASLTLNSGSAFSMADTGIGTFSLSAAGTDLTIGAATGTAPVLTFDIGDGATGTDKIAATGAASVGTTGGAITITKLATAASLTPGMYTLISATGGLGTGFTLNTTSLTIGGLNYGFSLSDSTTTNEILTVSAPVAGVAYYTGSQNNNLSTINGGLSNFATDNTGATNTQSIPTAVADVFFTADSAANLSTVLGGDLTFKSLTFTGTGTAATSPVTIGGANTLTLTGAAGTYALGTGIVINAGSGAHTISANLALGSSQSFTNNATSLFTISGNVNAGGNTLTLAGTGAQTISGNISGTGTALIKNGAAIDTLAGTNTYTGATTVNAGDLALTNAAALSGSGVTVASGAGLRLGGYGTYANVPLTVVGTGASGDRGALYFNNGNAGTYTLPGTITLAANTTIGQFGVSDTINFNGAIGGTGNLTFNPEGGSAASHTAAFNFNAPNTYTGATTFASGAGQLSDTYADGVDNALPTTTVLSLIPSVGTILYDLAGHSQTLAGLASAGTAALSTLVNSANATPAALTVSGTTSNTYTGSIGSATANRSNISLTKSGTGTQTLSGTSYYTGGTTVTAGSLTLLGTTDVGTGGVTINGGNVTIGSGTVNANNALGVGNAVTVNTGASLVIAQAQTAALNYAAFPITLNGNASLTFAGSNVNTFNIASPITLNGTSGTQTASITESNAADTVNLTGVISGTGDLLIKPGGTSANPFTVTLNQAETYSGNTTIQTAGGDRAIVKLLAGGSLPSTTILTENASGATFTATFDLNGQAQTLGGLVSAGTVTSDLVINSTNGTTSALTVNNAAANTYAGSIGSTTANTSNISLTKSGAGTLTLSGTNYYTGGTTINGGTIAIGSAANLGNTSGIVTINAGTLEDTGTFTTARNFFLGSTSSAINVDTGQTSTLTGTIADGAGPGTLNANGAGTLVLTGTNTYTGGTTINAGTVVINNASSLGDASGTATINAGTLEDTATFATSRNFLLGSTASTINIDNGQTYTINGTVNDGASAGTLNKTGLGTLALTAANNYTGGTHVSAGTITAPTSGYSTGAVTVDTTGTVDYTQGAVNSTYAANISGAGNVTFGGQGAGNSGTITYTGTDSASGGTAILSGTLSLSNGSGAALTGPVSIATSGTVALASNDQIAPSSNVALAGGTLAANGHSEGNALTSGLGTLTLSSNPANMASTLDFGDTTSGILQVPAANTLAFADSSALTWTGSVVLTNYTDGVDMFYIGHTNDLTIDQLSRITFGGLAAQQLATGQITFTAAPEPNSLLSLLVGGGVLGGIVIRKRRKSAKAQAA